MEFEEKLYAVGRIPGSFMRREGRPSLPAVLASRLIDRPMRPLFPYDFRNDVRIQCTVMSVDYDCSPEVSAMIGASACVSYSEIPFAGPIGCLEVGYCDGEIVLNPNQEQRKTSRMDVTVAATAGKVVMIEAGADEIPDEIMYAGIVKAHEEIKKQVAFINQIVAEIGKPKMEYDHAQFNQELFDKIVADFMDELKTAPWIPTARTCGGPLERRRRPLAKYLEEYPDMDQYLEEFTYKFQKKIVKAWLLEGTVWTAAPERDSSLAAEVGVLPWPTAPACSPAVRPRCSASAPWAPWPPACSWTLSGKRKRSGICTLQLPLLSVGEARAPRSTNRREYGHGALAERALVPVLPSVDEFPYAIRVVSEVLSSNGSTSQGSICGSTLALMDAGVPIKAPVAGISWWLIQDDDGSFQTFIDIQAWRIKQDGLRSPHQGRYHRHPDGPEERRPDP